MSSWNELLPELKNYPAILVTGAQRSGTTIAARILSQELNYQYIDESGIGTDNVGMARDALRHWHVVLQAPSLAHVCRTFSDIAVVFMSRNLSDIKASEQRIDWYWIQEKVQRYLEYPQLRGLHIAEIKMWVWKNEQKNLCNGFTLDYESLSSHPLWIAKSERQNFDARQWRKEDSGIAMTFTHSIQ